MNLSISTTDPQDDVLQALRRKHNRDNNVTLTLRQYLEGELNSRIIHLLDVASTYTGPAEIKEAFAKANNATQAQVKTLLGL